MLEYHTNGTKWFKKSASCIVTIKPSNILVPAVTITYYTQNKRRVVVFLNSLHTVCFSEPCQNPFVTKVAHTWRSKSERRSHPSGMTQDVLLYQETFVLIRDRNSS